MFSIVFCVFESCLSLFRFLPGGSCGSAVRRLDRAAFSGPSGSTVDDQPFTADSFYSWLLATLDEVCLPLVIVSI